MMNILAAVVLIAIALMGAFFLWKDLWEGDDE